MNLKEIGARSVLWSAVENGTTTLFAFVSLVVLAALLSPADFGVFSVCLALVEVAGIPVQLFFHDALVQRKQLTEAHFNAAWTGSIVLGLIFVGLLWDLFPLVARQVGDPRVTEVGRVLSCGLVVSGLSSVLSAQQARAFGFRLLAVRTFAGRTLGTAIGIGTALCGWGVWALVTQQLATLVLGAAALLAYAERRPRLIWRVHPLKELAEFGVLSTTAFFVSYSNKRLYLYLVGVSLGAEAAGIVTIAFKAVDTLWSISANAITQVLFAAMSRIQHERERLLSTYASSLRMAATLLFPAFTGIGVLSSQVVGLTLGAKWLPAAPAVTYLALLIYMSLPRSFATVLMGATGRLRPLVAANSGAAFVVAVGVCTIGFASSDSALWTWIAACSVDFGLGIIALSFCLGMTPLMQMRPIFNPALASATMAALLICAEKVMPDPESGASTVALIVIGAVTYILGMLLIDRGGLMESLRFFWYVLRPPVSRTEKGLPSRP